MLAIHFLAAFATGALSKLTDVQVDEKIFSFFHKMQYATAVAYGALAGYLLSASPEFSTVFLAVAIGVLLGKKIDAPAHQYAFAALFASIAVFGVKEPHLGFLALFVAFAALDEFASDCAEKIQAKASRGLNALNALKWFFSKRLLLDLSGLFVSIATGNFAYFFAIISFDLGYQAVSFAASLHAPKPQARGHQLLVDLYGASPKKLDDISFVYNFLDALPGKIGMTKIMPPYVMPFEPKDKSKKSERGISGIVLIAESHISIHTFPEKHSAKIDVYSCKEFDEKQVSKLIAKTFQASKIETKLLKRGFEHLSDLQEARKILVIEREDSRPEDAKK